MEKELLIRENTVILVSSEFFDGISHRGHTRFAGEKRIESLSQSALNELLYHFPE